MDMLRQASFIMGGFDSAVHLRPGPRRVDSIASSRHDVMAHIDYGAAASAGITCVRDGLRWHLIEASPGRYDWSSADTMVAASRDCRMPVIWDLCHWGWPAHIDIWSPAFAAGLADFAEAALCRLKAGGGAVAGIVPINEISFWAWAGGQHAGFAPHGTDQGDALKSQLVSAWLAAVQRIRAIDPTMPIITSEPLIVVHPNRRYPLLHARQAQAGMYEAWDMLLGRMAPELGGHAGAFDVMGVNWYPENQWRHGGRRLAPGHPARLRLRDLLRALQQRYAKPLMLTETGQEEPHGAAWLTQVVDECHAARDAGVDLRAVCVYPIMDYPGWENARHCPCGLIAVDRTWTTRTLRPGMLAAIRAANQVARGHAA